MEKSFYDTALSFQGINPNVLNEARKHEGFPAGGHMLPSFSWISVRSKPLEWADLVPSAWFRKQTEES